MFVLVISRHTAPADPVVEIISTGSFMVGTNLTLTCTVILSHPLREEPNIKWNGLEGRMVAMGTISISKVDSQTKTLTFSPLHTSHSGVYGCAAKVDIEEAGVLISNTFSLNVTVQSQ